MCYINMEKQKIEEEFFIEMKHIIRHPNTDTLFKAAMEVRM